jgi:7-cyano-7-deazaguanine tRNA-ribosyltransferase
MGFSFEVRQSDLFGRIGNIVANGRKVETPCLFPVVHPAGQSVGIDRMREMGFKGLMTNSYILYTRRREESLEKGIHRLLGFDGVIMTDSGGYQVLEYGEVDASYQQIAQFQSEIGSDLAVTLDRPTGYSASRKHARDTAQYSTRNALATINEFGGSETTWIGPVQGGLFSDILQRSTRALVGGGFRILALGSPVQVMVSYRYAELVRMIAATRSSMPYAMPLHLFGAGHPHAMAISIALGCDTFDSASYVLFAREGRYMTERGASVLKEMRYLPCSCAVCARNSVKDMLEMEAKERTLLLATHNLQLFRSEVETCKEAIAEGRLWDLVEERAASHPMLYEAFLEFASLSRKMEAGTASLKDRGLFVRGALDEKRPELSTARAMLSGAQKRSSKTALLSTTDQPLPVSRLRFKEGSGPNAEFDFYRLHPQLGLYQAELDFIYPFTQTVTALSVAEAKLAETGVRRLRKMGYRTVLLAKVDGAGTVALLKPKPTNKRKRAAAHPYPRSASPRPRGPRRP